jgi:hypothetical protein
VIAFVRSALGRCCSSNQCRIFTYRGSLRSVTCAPRRYSIKSIGYIRFAVLNAARPISRLAARASRKLPWFESYANQDRITRMALRHNGERKT